MSTVPKAPEQAADNQNDSGGEYFEAPTAGELEADQTSDEHLETPDVPDSEPSGPGAPRGKPKKKPSAISGRKFRKRDLVRIDTLRPSLADRIRADHPDLPPGARISRAELGRYRMRYMEELLQQEHGEFSELDRQVVESIARQDTISENSRGGVRGAPDVCRPRLRQHGGLRRQLVVPDLVRQRASGVDRHQPDRGHERAPSIPTPSSCSTSCSPALPPSRRRSS